MLFLSQNRPMKQLTILVICCVISTSAFNQTSQQFSGGEYNISTTAEGFTGISDYTKLHLFRRDDDANVWTAEGTHVAATGNSTTPIANRSAFTSLGTMALKDIIFMPFQIMLTTTMLIQIRWKIGIVVKEHTILNQDITIRELIIFYGRLIGI